MKIVIDIPDSKIPKEQELISVDLHFIDGKVCECTYPFEELPKGHGRLVDYDYMKMNAEEYGLSAVSLLSYLKPKVLIEAGSGKE